MLDKCSKCGYEELQSDMKFCPICGLELNDIPVSNKKLLSVKEFAHEYSIPAKKAYEMVKAKKFPVIIVGKKSLVIRERVDDWLVENIGCKF